MCAKMGRLNRDQGQLFYSFDLDEAVHDDHQVGGDEMIGYLASVNDCRTCVFKGRCCPKWPSRKITRSIYEPARDVARAIATTEFYQQTRRDRK